LRSEWSEQSAKRLRGRSMGAKRGRRSSPVGRTNSKTVTLIE